MLASADPNSDDNDEDDGFIDIDELLSSMRQKSVPASAPSNSGDMGGMVDNGNRGGSPPDSSRSTPGSSRGERTSFLSMARTSYSYDPRSDYAE